MLLFHRHPVGRDIINRMGTWRRRPRTVPWTIFPGGLHLRQTRAGPFRGGLSCQLVFFEKALRAGPDP